MNQLLLAWDERHAERELAAPTLTDVVERLSALDGVSHTLATLYRGDGHIACGGSARSGLVVYVTFDNETFWQLVDPCSPQSKVMVFAGGQAGDYPARHVVSIEAAIRAATTFFEAGGLTPDQIWDKQ